MKHKIELEFNQRTTADEVLDQITFSRLKQICDGLKFWDSAEDKKVIDACLALMDWMRNSDAED